MNSENYLRRISVKDPNPPATLETLKNLQRQHLLTVPFENLDIHWKKPIILDVEMFYKKIVGEKRGGFCYELNGLFNELLKEIGFQTKIISARVGNEKGNFSREYDHLAILVKAEGKEFLVDVGFGSFTSEPLKFVLDVEQKDETGIFKIRRFDEEYFEVSKKDGKNWHPQYIFKDLNRDLSEFAEMCQFHQTSPESHFTQGKVCSLMTAEGRKTLTDKKFIETERGVKYEKDIDSEKEFERILFEEFNIRRNFQ